MVMARNSAWRKNNRREIRHTIERYLAIMAIIALGTGFYSGLKITKSAMVNSMSSYLEEQHMYDYRLLSGLGLTKEDEQSFAEMSNIKAQGSVSMDFLAGLGNDSEVVLKAHSITDSVNKPNLRSGRMPEQGNECVLDFRFFSEDIIGSKIKVLSSNDEDTLDAFAYDEYTVVGIVNSVNYLNYDRGTTKLSGGSVHTFIYIPYDGFNVDYYTEILLELDNDGRAFSKKYDDIIAANKASIEAALKERARLRYEEIKDEATQKLTEAEEKYQDGLQEYLTQKADAENELDKALAELEDAKKEIEKSEAELTDGENKLAKAEEDYKKGLKDYEEAYAKYEAEKAEAISLLASQQQEIDDNRAVLTEAIVKIEESGVIDRYNQLLQTREQLQTALAAFPDKDNENYMLLQNQLMQTEGAIARIEASGVIGQYNELKNASVQLDAGQEALNKAEEEATRQFQEAEEQLKLAKTQLNEGKQEIGENRQKLANGWLALAYGKAEYEKGRSDYESARAEADEEFTKAKKELADAEEKIRDARKQVEDIPEAKVYVLDRNTNMGYANFDNDSSIVNGIAKVLPIYFFMVAALVCLTTMTRMVDEQRTQIGTLKALGYSDGAIIRKYMFYSGSAALIGCITGYLLGTKFFPMAIWKAYGMLYELTTLEYIFDIKLAIISLLVAMLCSAGITFISCKAELMQMPATLIRPRAPKPGRRVILERIPFIWNKVSFLHKVTIRNILRYKKRFIMTVTGIAGCTSLVVAAMGISDSIRNIANDQYETIMKYDYNISLSEAADSEERESFKQAYGDLLSDCVFVSTEEMEILSGNRIKKANVVITDDPAITNVIDLHLADKAVAYPDFGKIAVNDKLAKELGVAAGDYIQIKISDTDIIDAQISGTFDNYINNYLYMTAKTYKELFGEEPLYKSIFATAASDELYPIAATLADDDKVAVISVINDMRTLVENMMQSLDYIIWLVIVSAAALGFVVIYNLNNINITERNREIATIKVLGFYSWETRSYVFRETIVLTVIGSLLGLVLGKLLHGFIMAQINVEMVSFNEQIFAKSYIIAAAVTFVITFLVNIILLRKLEKINMTESLKAIE